MAQMSVVPFVPSDFSWRMYVDLNHDLSAVHDDAAARTHWLEHGFGQRRLYALHQLYVEDEFGNEVVLYIPYYCYLRDAGLLFGHRIHTYRGMRDIYIAAGFSPDQIVERHARRHWAPPARRPFVPPQSEHARRFDPEFRRPPPLRAAFADDAEAWTALRAAAGDDGRPLAIVHNKVNIEWGALRAVNAMPTDAVLSAVAQLLTEGFRVLYIRPRAAAAGPVGSIATARGFSEDAGELIECDDYAKLEARLATATASLTVNPNIDLSAHDRFFTAIGAGIMPLSDRNSYIAERFPEALPYSFDFTPGSIAAALEKLFDAPETALEAARAMRERTRASDGVEHAATAILEVIQSVRFLHLTPKPAQSFFVP